MAGIKYPDFIDGFVTTNPPQQKYLHMNDTHLYFQFMLSKL